MIVTNFLTRSPYVKFNGQSHGKITGSPDTHTASAQQAERPTDTPQMHPLLHLQQTIGNQAVARLLQTKLQVGQPRAQFEHEADRVSEQIVRTPDARASHTTPIAGNALTSSVQRTPETEDDERLLQNPREGFEDPVKEEEPVIRRMPQREEEDETVPSVQTKSTAAAAPPVSPTVTSNINAIRGGGEPLPPSVRAHFEPQFGADFGQVRVHKDARAAASAEAMNAKAYTTGNDIAFGGGEYAPETAEGGKLLAHELAHVVQQAGGGKRVQRYEAGEHAQLGETQAELQPAVAPISYTVKKGDRLSAIAHQFGITVAEIKAANKDKLNKWPAKDGSGRMIEGFNVGETVSIPQKLNDFAKDVTKDKSATFTVNGVVLDYGVGIAMGDFFESPEQMAKASPDQLKELADLIKREQTGGKPVTTAEWQKATRGRYLKLNRAT